jgi:hypothetical protein
MTHREKLQAKLAAAVSTAVLEAGEPSEVALKRVAKVLATLSEDH